MPRVLILSSYVAASRVGGSAQALALARLGVDPVLVPTVLFGRHPGLGPPGGGPVEPEVFGQMLAGVEAQGAFAAVEAVITGHFSRPEQVLLAAETIERVRAASRQVRIIVDPVMGDAPGGLYVREPVAEAIARTLAPLADLVAPNAWELAHLTGLPLGDPAAALTAAAAVGRPVLVSSVPVGDEIGVVYADGATRWLASHPASAAAPKGTGDLLTAFFTAALIEGLAIRDALAAAVGALAEVVAAAGAGDAPIEALPTRLAPSPRVRVEALGG